MKFSLIGIAQAARNAPIDVPTNFLGRFDSVADVIGVVLNIVFYVGISITVIFLIMGGIRYITSGGSKEGAEAARGMITSAIIGFVVVLGAFAIRIIVGNILGPSVPNNFVPGF